jgi:hypothetical protein
MNPENIKVPLSLFQFDVIVKNAFKRQFTARKSPYSGVRIYKWGKIK